MQGLLHPDLLVQVYQTEVSMSRFLAWEAGFLPLPRKGLAYIPVAEARVLRSV